MARWANHESRAAPCQCFDARFDDDDVARVQFARCLALGLVPAAPRGAQEDLTNLAAGVVDVPVVAAARLEGDVRDLCTLADQRLQVGLAGEVPGVGVIRLTAREDIGEGGHGVPFVNGGGVSSRPRGRAGP